MQRFNVDSQLFPHLWLLVFRLHVQVLSLPQSHHRSTSQITPISPPRYTRIPYIEVRLSPAKDPPYNLTPARGDLGTVNIPFQQSQNRQQSRVHELGIKEVIAWYSRFWCDEKITGVAVGDALWFGVWG